VPKWLQALGFRPTRRDCQLRSIEVLIEMTYRQTFTILQHLTRLEVLVMTNQEQIDAYAAQLGGVAETIASGLSGIRADVEALKAQIQAGTPAEELDFSGLEASLVSLESAANSAADLDAENPPPAPEEPTEPAPVPVDPEA
jgi:hypothetical protein